MKNQSIRIYHYLSVVVLFLLLTVFTPSAAANAGTASAVTLGVIDYEELTIQVYDNDNSVVYYSVDNQNWIEVEGPYISGAYHMDISWVSTTSDVILYFKGDLITRTVDVTIPMQINDFRVTFNKADGEFTFENADHTDSFEWRKASNYAWTKVSLDETSASYEAFLDTVETFRVKSAKIIIRLPQDPGNAFDPGNRPSKEVTITIPSRAEAPSIVVNSSKLTLNTTTTLEYYDEASDIWVECTKGMTIEELAPEVLYENGAKDASYQFRKAATDKVPYSKTVTVKIPGQPAPPLIGGNTEDVSYYYVNSKLVLVFNLASKTNLYEYCIIKPGAEFDVATAKWVTVSASKPMTLSNSTAPDGCTVYVRKKGTDANASKNVSLQLSSAIKSFDVNLPAR